MDNNTETYTKTFSIDLERANYHHKCKIRRRKRLLLVLIVWFMIFVYLFTPLSKVNLKVSGNVYYAEEELMNMSYIKKNEYWWLVDTKKVKRVLNSYEYIDGVSLKKSIFGIEMKIEEIYPVAVKDNKYIMSNNQKIEKTEYDLNEKVGELTDFNSIEDHDLGLVINEYKTIDLSIRSNFRKIELVKSEIATNEYYNYVKLYGEDERIGSFVIKVDLVYLNTKFNENKYNKIMESISKNNVKYEGKPALIAYHDLDEAKFYLVDEFKEE